MDEEELVTLPLFHELYADQELAALQTALVASIPPKERGELFELMVLSSNHEARVALLRRLKSELPAPTFAKLTDSLWSILSEAERDRLHAAL